MKEFIDSKTFLVDAEDLDAGNYFFAFETATKEVYSIEIIPENYPSKSVAIYANLEDFIKATTWQDWLIAGIKDADLKELITNK